MPAFLMWAKSNWKPLLIAIAALSLLAYVTVLKHQRNAAIDALQAFKIQVQVAAKVQEAEVAKTITKQEAVTTTTALAYNDSIQRLRSYYEKPLSTKGKSGKSNNVANGVQLPTLSNSSEVPAIPETTSRTDDTTEGDQSGSAGITLNCAEDVLKLLKLQQWVRGQEQVN